MPSAGHACFCWWLAGCLGLIASAYGQAPPSGLPRRAISVARPVVEPTAEGNSESPTTSPPVALPAPIATPRGAFQERMPPVRVAALSARQTGTATSQTQSNPASETPANPVSETPANPVSETPAAEPVMPKGDAGNPFIVPVGEAFELDVPAEVGEPEEDLLIRPTRMKAATSFILLRPAKGPKFFSIRGSRAGPAEITLIGETDSRKYHFVFVPSLTDLESVLLVRFPNSSLKLSQPTDNIIIVEGAVDSAAEIEPILELLKDFLPPQLTKTTKVISAMQVVGPMQVQLEVMIARVDRSRLRQLGFNFTQSDGPWYSGSQLGNIIRTPPIDGKGLFPLPGAATGVAGDVAPSTMTAASTLFLGLTQAGSSFGVYLEALEQQNAIKVLARPVLVTMSGRPAEFLNGGEQPYLTVAGISQSPNVQFKKFGTRLNFVPVVMGQGKIRLDLAPSVSAVDQTSPSQAQGTFLPLFVEQSLHASVEMESGQTLIMGGMYQTSSEAVVRKVPCLGDLPLVGAAFRRVSHVLREQELMVVVTPRLVHPLDPHQVPSHVPGDETCNPTNKQLYCHGLPEVERSIDQSPPTQQTEFPAPLQYPQWEPANINTSPPNEALPSPMSMRRPPATEGARGPTVAMQRLPPTNVDVRAMQAAGRLAPPGGAVAPVQWNAPLSGVPANDPLPIRSPGRY